MISIVIVIKYLYSATLSEVLDEQGVCEVFRCLQNWSNNIWKRSPRDWGRLFQLDGHTL